MTSEIGPISSRKGPRASKFGGLQSLGLRFKMMLILLSNSLRPVLMELS